MPKYKMLYDICVDSWKEDWEVSKHLSEKARTYIITIGLIFGYSILNFNTFYGALEDKIRVVGKNPQILLTISAMLFITYFTCFAIALLFTLISIWIRTDNSKPIFKSLDEFKPQGPSDESLERIFYDLSEATLTAVAENEKITARQGWYLSIAVKSLTIGFVTFTVIGAIYLFLKLFV